MDKEQTAIERLRMASEMSIKHYGTPLVVTTSGGKDSAVCVALAERAGIPFEAMHNHTTVDAPETVRFVREDFRRLEEKGVKVFNAPGLNGNAVAELTICKMLELSRHTIPAHRDVTVNEKWDKYAFVGRELRGKTLGVLGFGRIGQRVGEIARVFGMKIVAYDPYLPAEVFAKNEATSMSIAEVCKVSDYITIHMPLNDETKNLFNAKSIAEMKSDAVVLNMARGGIVNEKDMCEALKAGKIGGYATDVLENEVAGDGLTADAGFRSPLFDCDNFVVSPHIGAQTTDASRDIGAHIINKVKEALDLK